MSRQAGNLTGTAPLATAAVSTRLAPFALPAILALATALRFANLGENSLWSDEAYSVIMAQRDPVEIVHKSAAVDSHPPLYYLLLSAWIAIFGDSEYAVRSLSAVIGVLVVAVVYLLGRRIAGRRVGLVASLVAAISPFYLLYSQEARMYILAALLAGLSFLAFLHLLELRSRRNAVLYVLATVLLLYTHVYGLFVLLAQLIVLLLRTRELPRSARAGELRSWTGIAAAIGVLYLPWLVVIGKQTRDEVRGTVNTNITWLDTPSPDWLGTTLVQYAGSEAALVVIGLVCAGAIVVAWRAARPGVGPSVVAEAFGGRSAPMLATWLATPIVVPFLISVAFLPIYFPKYTIPASVAFYLLLATAIGRLGRGLAGAIALAAVVAVMLEGAVAYHRTYTTAPWRDSMAFLAGEAKEGDIVLLDKDFSRTNSFAYYWHREDVVAKEEEEDLVPLPKRVWVVVSLDPDDPGAVPRRLGRLGFEQTLTRHWDGDVSDVDILLFERAT
ncbi:MAG: glycosyltransferase family 39 protein [Gaiellales bacterium]